MDGLGSFFACSNRVYRELWSGIYVATYKDILLGSLICKAVCNSIALFALLHIAGIKRTPVYLLANGSYNGIAFDLTSVTYKGFDFSVLALYFDGPVLEEEPDSLFFRFSDFILIGFHIAFFSAVHDSDFCPETGSGSGDIHSNIAASDNYGLCAELYLFTRVDFSEEFDPSENSIELLARDSE